MSTRIRVYSFFRVISSTSYRTLFRPSVLRRRGPLLYFAKLGLWWEERKEVRQLKVNSFSSSLLPIRTGLCLLVLQHGVAGNLQIVASNAVVVHTKTI